MGLIQQLETTLLAPVAAASCDVMTLLRPTALGTSFPGGEAQKSREGDPAGSDPAASPKDITWEAVSCVVSYNC